MSGDVINVYSEFLCNYLFKSWLSMLE